ncbi:MAG TPA: 2-C-methyl-D-erythritol 2,4-cyclodiphosphate synthase [Actinomycetota bacterium]|nr:2-C-methyl-D-erythritol 2,4-cyclodiphosphate synthase [Actinomycetota bacterium]
MRVGTGFDVHAFDDDRPLIIGGVLVPEAPGLGGHSDADVLSHAVTDALLGAVGLGDLGALYPATNEWRDASSLSILADAVMRTREAGWVVSNVDCTVIAERPRLGAFKDEMAANLARTLDVEPDAVSVKATTTDGLGFTGRGEGIAAQAVVVLASSAGPES